MASPPRPGTGRASACPLPAALPAPLTATPTSPCAHAASNPHIRRRRASALGAWVLFAVWAALALDPWIDPRAAAQGATAAVQGTVVDSATGAPVPGANVSIPDLGLSAQTDAGGLFAWPVIALSEPTVATTIQVQASGYGDWEIVNVRLVAGDTLLLRAELGTDPVHIVAPSPVPDRSSVAAAMGAAQLEALAVDQTGLPIPRTIRVRVTGYPYCDTTRPYTVQVIDFVEYVKHVLPNEWVNSWPGESLRAGAMAVKMYAWSVIAAGGKWPDADVYDSTCDQVYNPSVAYASTNAAVDFTWNWRLTRDSELVRTFYRAYLSQCPSGLGGNCMGQWESRDLAFDRYTWDEILQFFYTNTVISGVDPVPGGWSLRYEGNGYGDLDRVKILLDGPARPVDVGASDFTLEWWMKALPGQNGSTACTPGGDNWIRGNALLDRDVFGAGDYGDYGISLAGGRLAFGVHNGTEAQTMCGSARVDDGVWHHVAVTRRSADGWLAIYVDGALNAEGDGPDGDLSYRDGRTSTYPNDPFLVIGAEKHDTDRLAYPSFRGWVDEVRVSLGLRYASPFPTPAGRFSPDPDTMALYHFDRGFGDTIEDSAGAAGGPSTGLREYGGVVNGPEWTSDSPWYVVPTPTPTLSWPTATATPSRTPTRTASPTPTQTPSSTPTPTGTSATTATLTHTATAFASATRTPTPTATSSGTPTSAPSVVPSPTQPTASSATETPTSTAVHTPTHTASPVPSSTPGEQVRVGDLNQDGAADVVDLQLCVNVILEIETSPAIVAAADLNQDGEVNILDVQALVNIILGV